MIKFISSILITLLSYSFSQQQVCKSISGFNDVIIDYNKPNVRFENGLLNMYLTQDTGGSGIIIGPPIQYGEISVTLKTSYGNNIVNAFYLKAPNGDEIDFEMVMNKTIPNRTIQTAFYYRGIPLYEVNARYFMTDKPLSDVYNKYTIVWMPDYYEWRLNDTLLSRVNRFDTNTYPDTISSIKITIWDTKPGRWGGPGVNWNQQPFVLSISAIEVKCSNNPITQTTQPTQPTQPTQTQKTQSNKPITTQRQIQKINDTIEEPLISYVNIIKPFFIFQIILYIYLIVFY
jgi:beta-glucanase (GH16 family)